MISILFQTETHFPVNRKKIREAILSALEKKIKGGVEVSVAVVGDRRMKELNRAFRKADGTTDVLAFPLSDPAYTKGQAFVNPPDGILRLGDIIISYPQAIVSAIEENRLVDDCIVTLALHGLDHLLGIHHN